MSLNGRNGDLKLRFKDNYRAGCKSQSIPQRHRACILRIKKPEATQGVIAGSASRAFKNFDESHRLKLMYPTQVSSI